MALTARKVATAKKPGRYRDETIPGLYLQISVAGVKSWLLRFEQNGRERWHGLGPLHTVGLAEARERARRARLQLLDGIDPIEAKKAAKAAAALEASKATTFSKAAQQYNDANERKWRNRKSAAQFLSTLRTYAFPVIGRLSVADIDTGLVLKCIEPIWNQKTETANRVRNRIERVLDWATVRELRNGDNPARWNGHLENVLPAPAEITKTKHHAALPYADHCRLHGRASNAGGRGRRSAGVPDPDCRSFWRGPWRQLDRNRLGRQDLDGASRSHQRWPRASCAAVRSGARNTKRGAARRRQRTHIYWHQPGRRPEPYRDVYDPRQDGPRQCDGPRFPIDIPRLGGRDDGLPQPRGGDGARTRDWRQGGSRLSAR